jgi:hypothetical protein
VTALALRILALLSLPFRRPARQPEPHRIGAGQLLICRICDTVHEDDGRFCGNCGTEILP